MGKGAIQGLFLGEDISFGWEGNCKGFYDAIAILSIGKDGEGSHYKTLPYWHLTRIFWTG